jgi:hypothetical protein
VIFDIEYGWETLLKMACLVKKDPWMPKTITNFCVCAIDDPPANFLPTDVPKFEPIGQGSLWPTPINHLAVSYNKFIVDEPQIEELIHALGGMQQIQSLFLDHHYMRVIEGALQLGVVELGLICEVPKETIQLITKEPRPRLRRLMCPYLHDIFPKANDDMWFPRLESLLLGSYVYSASDMITGLGAHGSVSNVESPNRLWPIDSELGDENDQRFYRESLEQFHDIAFARRMRRQANEVRPPFLSKMIHWLDCVVLESTRCVTASSLLSL